MGASGMLWMNGPACVALAALLFSVATLWVKLSSDDLSAFTICAVTSFGAAIVILVAASLTRVSLAAPTRRAQVLVALRALFGACTLLAYYAAVEVSGIRDSTALYFTSPLFTLLFECIFRGRWPRHVSMLGAVATAAGALMVSERCLCSMIGGGSAVGTLMCGAPPSVTMRPQLLYVHPASPQLPPPPPPSPPRRASFASTISHTLTSHLGHGPWEESPELRERQHQQQRQQMQQLQLHVQVQQQRLESQQRRLIEELKFRPGEGEGAGQSGSGGSRQRPSQGESHAPWHPGEVPSADLSLLGTTLALSAAATNALSFVTVRALGKTTPTLTLTFWHQAIIAVVASSSEAILSALHPKSAAKPDPFASLLTPAAPLIGARDAALLFGIFLALLAAQVLQNRGLAITAPSRGAAINVLQVVFCFLWDVVILGNKLQASSTVGGGLIVAGVLALTSQLPASDTAERDKAAAAKKDRDVVPRRRRAGPTSGRESS